MPFSFRDTLLPAFALVMLTTNVSAAPKSPSRRHLSARRSLNWQKGWITRGHWLFCLIIKGR